MAPASFKVVRRIDEKRPRHLRPPRYGLRNWLLAILASAGALAILFLVLSYL